MTQYVLNYLDEERERGKEKGKRKRGLFIYLFLRLIRKVTGFTIHYLWKCGYRIIDWINSGPQPKFHVWHRALGTGNY